MQIMLQSIFLGCNKESGGYKEKYKEAPLRYHKQALIEWLSGSYRVISGCFSNPMQFIILHS